MEMGDDIRILFIHHPIFSLSKQFMPLMVEMMLGDEI
jgi:hypothetical protein